MPKTDLVRGDQFRSSVPVTAFHEQKWIRLKRAVQTVKKDLADKQDYLDF